MNSQSSRSHAIFSVIMSQQRGSSFSSGTPRMNGLNGSRPPSKMGKRSDDIESVTITSKLHFVDLAGSERVSYIKINNNNNNNNLKLYNHFINHFIFYH
jgi:hypothetical protein